MLRRLRSTSALVGCLAAVSCEQGLTPTAPTGVPTSVTPFIASSPPPYTGSVVPVLFGVWAGAMQLTDCRAAPPSVCKVSTTPRDIRLVALQQDSTLTGAFSMNEPSVDGWVFAGYVTAGGGIAGTATIDGGSRVIVRLTSDGTRLSGEVADAVWTNGRLTFTRHFVVSTPLTRFGPTL